MQSWPATTDCDRLQAAFDVLDEQGIVALVSHLTGKDNLGLLAGDGWTGDDLYRWEPEKPGAAGFTSWFTHWVSPEEAADFEYGWVRSLQSRFPGSIILHPGQGMSLLATEKLVVRVNREGAEVRIRIATPEVDLRLEPRREPSPASRVPKGQVK
jgi:hypothetical protein